MNAKLLTLVAASLLSNAVSAAECPARAGVCQSYEPTVSVQREYSGTPVTEVIGRGTPVLSAARSGKSHQTVVDTRHLYKFGRA